MRMLFIRAAESIMSDPRRRVPALSFFASGQGVPSNPFFRKAPLK
jgi:hypothetical protein